MFPQTSSNSDGHLIHLLFIAAILALGTTVLNAYHTSHLRSQMLASRNLKEYSYLGDNFPPRIPRNIQPAVMSILNGSDIYPLEDDRKWASVVPPGHGFVRMGSTGRPFAISMGHQLHCLNGIRFAYIAARDNIFSDPDEITASFNHANHCFDLIRQSILCNADTTLVPTGESGTPGTLYGTLHRCRDWTQVRSFMASNQKHWKGVPLEPDFPRWLVNDDRMANSNTRYLVI